MSITSGTKTTLDIVSSVALTVAAGLLIWNLAIKPRAAARSAERVESVSGLRLDAKHLANVVGKGPIAIIEFSDFQCPFCSSYARDTLPTIRKELVDRGMARYIALQYPLEEIHPLALRAGQAAECAGMQGRFWEMHERLFAESKTISEDRLIALGDELQLKQSEYRSCLESGSSLAKIRADQAEGKRLGISGTPAFFIGTVRPDGGIDLVTRIRGAAPVELFSSEVAKVAARMGAVKS